MNLPRPVLLATSTLLLALNLGCEHEGPAEQAGEQIDEAVEKLSQPKDPVEEAGEAIDEAVDEVNEELEKVRKKVGVSVEEAGEKLQGDDH